MGEIREDEKPRGRLPWTLFFLPSSTRTFRSNFFGQPLRYNQNSNVDAKEGGVRKKWELTKEHEGWSGGKKILTKLKNKRMMTMLKGDYSRQVQRAKRDKEKLKGRD